MNIHPSAVVHPHATVADDVQIGPYAVLEEGARVGKGSIIQAHAIICGSVQIGERNLVGYGAVIGGDPQDFSFRPETRSAVRIGHDNRIREHCTIHRGTADGSVTSVGDRCFIMSGAHLGHNVQVGNDVVLANNVLLGGYVVVQDRVFIGGGAVFHQFVRVGRLAICQGKSGFSKDIPPFTIGAERNHVAGLNVVGLRRAGMGSQERATIKAAFDIVYRSGRNVKQALEASQAGVWSPQAREFFDFIAAAKGRGICALLRQRNSENSEGGTP